MLMKNTQLERAAALSEQIEKALTEGRYNEAGAHLDEYAGIVQDAAWYSLKMNEAFQLHNLDEAVRLGYEALVRLPYHSMLHYNLGVILQVKQEYESSATHLTYATKYAVRSEDVEAAKQELGRTLAAINENQGKQRFDYWMGRCKSLLAEQDERSYPIDRAGRSVVRQILGSGTQDERMANLYRTTLASDVNANTRLQYAVETYKGRECKEGTASIFLRRTSVVPISLLKPDTELVMEHGSETYRFQPGDLKHNHYYYFRFDGSGELNIRSSNNIFVGTPIPLEEEQLNAGKPKLVLNIFIDGLAFETLRKRGLADTMPNCLAFFKEGLIATNCYSTGEWTLPAVASIFTGKYTNNHGLFHPDYHYPLEERNKLMQEFYQESGYFTAQFSNNWRVTPNHGYYKGFDRSVYQNLFGGMNADEIVMEVIQHIETFRKRDNFVWMCLEDLHHIPDEVELNLGSQVNTDMRYREREREKGPTTVLTSYDRNKSERYVQEIKRIDFNLGILFDYLSKRYEQHEYIVVLYSDHGQSFLEEESYVLSEKRRKVPFMMAGHQVPKLEDDNFMETVDILPILLKQSGIPIPGGIEGKLPVWASGEGRSFAFSESIHPDQTYKAAITDDTHMFRFNSLDNVSREGTFSLREYEVRLLNRQTQEDETGRCPDKVRFYENLVFDHVKHRNHAGNEEVDA